MFLKVTPISGFKIACVELKLLRMLLTILFCLVYSVYMTHLLNTYAVN